MRIALLLLAALPAVSGGLPAAQGAGQRALGINLDVVNRLLRAELGAAPTGRRLSTNESALLFDVVVEHEWKVARLREQDAHLDGRRLRCGLQAGASPFLLCNSRAGYMARLSGVERLAGTSFLLPIYNKADMTCFAVEALPSKLDRLPTGFAAIPMVPEMKMEHGLVNRIESSLVARLEVVACRGEVGDEDELLALGLDILDKMLTNDRRLRLEAFLTSRAALADRHENWRRSLQGVDETGNGACRNMLDTLTMDASGDMLMFTLSKEYVDLECLHTLVIEMALQPEVCFIGGYQQIETRNVLASGIVQSGHSNLTPFYDAGIDGGGQIVAVSDTGLDVNNCYFWDADVEVLRDRSGSVELDARKVVQYYAYSDDTDQLEGHGTHVCGSIVGHRAPFGRSESDGKADGVAKGAKLAMFDLGYANGSLAAVGAATAFKPGFTAGARIHSASWGSPDQNGYATLDSSIDSFMHDNPDFLVIVAAGNDGTGEAAYTVSSPAICKNAIAVGASQNAAPHIYSTEQGPDYVADYSSRGPTADGRIKPDLMAPGMYILSARSVPLSQGECDNSWRPGTFFKSGTSMSAPIVAGTAALVRQYFIDGWYGDGTIHSADGFSPRASLVKAVLMNGGQALQAVDAPLGGTYSTSQYDFTQGFGRVNLLRSLPLKGENLIAGVFINDARTETGQVDRYPVEIVAVGGCNEPLRATLTWTDPAGAPFCLEGCVLNDLDLYITKEGGAKRLYPNGRDSADTTNNVERIVVEYPKDGEQFTVQVEGRQLLQSQNYSLAVTGCFVGVSSPSESPVAIEESPINEDDCVDGAGLVLVNDGTRKDCAWVEANFATHGYLCSFVDVAKQCPRTCKSCSLFEAREATIATTAFVSLSGGSRWYGVQFDVEARKDLSLQGYYLHLNVAGSYWVQIYSRADSSAGSDDPWTLICNATTVSETGYGALSSLPSCEPLSMVKGDVRTLYITLVHSFELVVTDEGTSPPDDVFEDDAIAIKPGVAVEYFDGAILQGYSFNGAVNYTIKDETSSDCGDRAGSVWMDNIAGSRPCSWLADQLDRFGYVCSLAIAAAHCRDTCQVC